jgi:hypothetical protein
MVAVLAMGLLTLAPLAAQGEIPLPPPGETATDVPPATDPDSGTFRSSDGRPIFEQPTRILQETRGIATTTRGANIVVNGDLSTDLLTPWKAAAGLNVTVNQQSMSVTEKSTAGRKISQDLSGFNPAADTDLEISVDIANDGNATKTVELRLMTKYKQGNQTVKEKLVCVFNLPGKTPLTRFSMRANLTKDWNGAALRVAFKQPTIGGTVRFDNFNVSELTGADIPDGVQCPSNDMQMVSNGTFNTDTSGWKFKGASQTVNNGVLEVTGSSSANKAQIKKALLTPGLKPGTPLEFSAYVRNESDQSKTITIRLDGVKSIGGKEKLKCIVEVDAGFDGFLLMRAAPVNKLNSMGLVLILPTDGIPGLILDGVSLRHKPNLTIVPGTPQCLSQLVSEAVPDLTQPLIALSPADGESGVAVTRETIIRFKSPIQSASVTNAAFTARFNNQTLGFRLQHSADRRSVTLFYDDALPASARIELLLDGDLILDDDSVPVDINLDGVPGGQLVSTFDTLSLTVIPGTEVCGRVFASEIDAANPTRGVNVPLQGVNISVDTLESTLHTSTDSAGNFCLNPAPAGRFFVHVDGRTATNGVPSGAYYPFVGKAWDSIPGASVNIGDVFLPLVPVGTLQNVSEVVDVSVGFAPEVVQQFPGFEDVRITVPAGSLYTDDGAPGGMVGIAPVPPDRLPGQLPPGLNFPVVITVQTDGATNFDTPAPVCFPNLPDPETGIVLAPGEKSALWSFNHDTGMFEIAGPMTVSLDGALVCSDPGYGVKAPGWHGVFSGVQSLFKFMGKLNNCANILLDAGPCEQSLWSVGIAAAEFGVKAWEMAEPLAAAAVAGTACAGLGPFGVAGCAAWAFSAVQTRNTVIKSVVKNAVIETGKAVVKGQLTGKDSVEIMTDAAKNFVFEQTRQSALNLGSPLTSYINTGIAFADSAVEFVQAVDSPVLSNCVSACTSQFRSIALPLSIPLPSEVFSPRNVDDYTFAYEVMADLFGLPTPTAQELADFNTAANDLESMIETLPSRQNLKLVAEAVARAEVLIRKPGPTEADVDQLLVEISYIEDNLDAFLNFQVYYSRDIYEAMQQAEAAIAPLVAPADEDIYYMLSYNGVTQRKRSNGPQVTELLPALTLVEVSAFQPSTHLIGRKAIVTGQDGSLRDEGFVIFLPSTAPDTDGDGLTDDAETIIGTGINVADSDSDGVRDGAEVDQGTDPLDGLPARTGIIATADTPGFATDVCITNNVAVVADSAAGVASFFNVFNGMTPTLISQVNTPGAANIVACDGTLVAIADGASGLAILDISTPSTAFIARQIDLGSTVRAVTADGGNAYVALESGDIVIVEMSTGAVLGGTVLGTGALANDLVVNGDYLYMVTNTRLYAFPLYPGQIGTGVFVTSAGVTYRSLFVGNAVVYATHSRGYNTFSLSNPASPTLIANGSTAQLNWATMKPNGSGFGVATVGVNGGSSRDVNVYNTSNPAQTNTFITTFSTPGNAQEAVFYNGLVYVADGVAGLQVVNVLAYDALGVPPTISLVSSVGGTATQGATVRYTANVIDDVQVRSVGFYRDGVLSYTDISFPFEYRFKVGTAPGSLSVSARAVDTGGNTADSAVLISTIVPDTTPPVAFITRPAANEIFTTGAATLPVTVDVTDNVGVDWSTAQFTLGGSPVVAARTSYNTFTLPMPQTPGTINIGFSASDVSGLSTIATVVPVEVIDFAIGVQIITTINYRGDVDDYVFQAVAGQELIFDELVNGKVLWKLTDPNGTVVFDADMFERKITVGVTGAYLLRFVGWPTAADVENYGFKIWLVPPPQTFNIAIGDTVSNGVPSAGAGVIESPGAMDIYSFAGTIGQDLTFDETINDNVFWKLVAPSGAVLFDGDGLDRRLTLAETGTYSMSVVSWYLDGVETYGFKIWLVPPPQNFNIAIGDTVSNGVPSPGAGVIESPGAMDIYSFAGTIGQDLTFDETINDNVFWKLVAPSGSVLFDGDGLDRRLTLAETGTHTMTVVSWYLDGVETYGFKVWIVPPPQNFNIAIGDTVSNGVPSPGAGVIESPGAMDIYSFTGTVGQDIIFNETINDNVYWTLTAPSGAVLFDGDGLDRRVVLLETGTYTLSVVSWFLDGVENYGFKIWLVPPAENFSIAIGDAVSNGVPLAGAGNLESPGAADVYTFTGSSGQNILFDTSGPTGNNRVTLTSPGGTKLIDNSLFVDAARTLPETGAYTLRITGNAIASYGTYIFAITAQ